MTTADDLPVTKKELQNSLHEFKNEFKNELKGIFAEWAEVILKGVGELLKDYATKEDLSRVEKKVDVIDNKVSDLSRRMNDLEHDTPSQKDVESLKTRVIKLETAVFPA